MTRCICCNKPLKDFEEVHAVRGMLYCSRECAISAITDDMVMNANDAAIEEYESCAEVVATRDILANEMCELVREENSEHVAGVSVRVYPTYIESEDKTVVWQDLCVNGEVVQTSITGWHYGRPDKYTIKHYGYNNNVAHFM